MAQLRERRAARASLNTSCRFIEGSSRMHSGPVMASTSSVIG